MDLEYINQQILNIQKLLSSKNISDIERFILQDNLTYLLDCRALTNTKYGITKEELN